jgi:NhaP-type Na+/H+ or K+/H+ antiporter
VQEQFIMSYGGLRGAVGFSLVKLIDKSIVPSAGIFVTATLAVIMSTVFIQVKQQI